jgi:hypothetical protein
LLTLAVAVPVSAATPLTEAAVVETAADGLIFRSLADHDGLTLTVTGPEGFFVRQTFAAGEDAVLAVTSWPDGTFGYELIAAPVLDDATRTALARARRTGDESIVRRLRGSGKLPAEPSVRSGFFTILHGSLVDEAAVEPSRNTSDSSRSSNAGGIAAVSEGAINVVIAEDQVIPDDLIVQRSLCVGFDCVNNEDFGFDTIRLKENSLRIKFQDTSTGAGFPTRDWQLTANDSASGGANKFSIEDIDGARVPFTVLAGAPSNSLFVDSSGRLGLGTSTPVLNAHIVTGNTPALRLEQNNSSGFAPQTWDIAGNETSFFIRDVTGGSRLPFRIQPAAPSNSLFIANDGDVILGGTTADPDVRLQVQANTAANFAGLRVTNGGAGNIQTHFAGNGWEWRQTFRSGDLLFDSQEDGANEMVLTTGGQLTVASLVQTSDRNLKENVLDIEPDSILHRLAEIPIQRWNFKEDPRDTPHLGPMAQDFYAAFGLGEDDRHIAATDADGVALAAIQALYRRLLEKESALTELQEANRLLTHRLDALEARQP